MKPKKQDEEITVSKGVRAKKTIWDAIQKVADKEEMGNLNHTINKIFISFLKARAKRKNI